jgi:hypothetical protein
MTLARRPEAGCDGRAEPCGEAAPPETDAGPARVSERLATWRTFGVLMLGALLGVVFLPAAYVVWRTRSTAVSIWLHRLGNTVGALLSLGAVLAGGAPA